MRNIIEGFIIILFIGFIAYASLGFINMNNQTADARGFLESAVTDIERSGFSDTVIGAWQDKAQDCGYELVVSDASTTIIDKKKHCIEIQLKYTANNPFFRIKEQSTIKEYAR